MRRMKTALLFPAALALALSFIPLDALAWGAQGHRLVARIAETELTPQTKAEVDRLLAGEPEPSLSAIAAWADELRANDPDLGRRSAAWHYVNLGEDGCHYTPAKHCKNGNCVIEALKAQSAILADRSKPLAERRQALKFVVHLVGDIHQPMHAGYANDKGGNNFQVQYNGRGTNLHSLWDSGMFYDQRLNDDAYLQRLLAQPQPAHESRINLQRDIAGWAESSCQVAIRPGVYPAKRTLDAGYADVYRPIAEARLRLAGERLATLLNQLLGGRMPASPTR
jgi:hypothetical protein